MKMRLAVAVGALALLAQPALAQKPSSDIKAAVADACRPATDTKLDDSRHPAEMLSFAGIKSGQVVMDVWPGAGYWTRIFSKAVGPNGKVYAYVPAEIADFKSDPVGKAKAVAAEPGWGNVTEVSDPLASAPPPQFHNTVDVVWTFDNYHDLHDKFLKGADVGGFNRAVFALLKPGGVYVIVDHAAVVGSGLKNTEDLHRIEPAAVRAEVEKVGFKYLDDSKVLANPADLRTAAIFDPAIKGKTDRFAYRFQKPLN